MIKRIMCVLVVSIMTFSIGSLAARGQRTHKKMQLSIDVLDLVSGELPIIFRFGVSERVSLGVSAYGRLFGFGPVQIYGAGGGVQAKFHLSSSAFHDGWYFKPEFNIGFLHFKVGNKLRISPRMTFGYDWIWNSGFSIGFGGGLSYSHNFYKIKIAEKDYGVGLSGFWPSLDFDIGWVF